MKAHVRGGFDLVSTSFDSNPWGKHEKEGQMQGRNWAQERATRFTNSADVGGMGRADTYATLL